MSIEELLEERRALEARWNHLHADVVEAARAHERGRSVETLRVWDVCNDRLDAVLVELRENAVKLRKAVTGSGRDG